MSATPSWAMSQMPDAGIISVISDLKQRTPIIAMPCLTGLHKQSNEHLITTTQRFARQGPVALDELRKKLDPAGTLYVGARSVRKHRNTSLPRSVFLSRESPTLRLPLTFPAPVKQG